MRRLNPGLAIAIAAAALAGGSFGPASHNARVLTAEQAANQAGALNRLPGFASGALAAVFGEGDRSGFSQPRYRNRFPVSVAQGKRNARKRRNKLRARGQHRKAVR